MLGMLDSYLVPTNINTVPATDGLVALVALGTNDMQEILAGGHGKTIADAVNNIINPNDITQTNTVVGKIIIPKEIGEGLFGVSFKIKGLPKQTKTSVNPLKTLTPRFITKALEKSKSKAQ